MSSCTIHTALFVAHVPAASSSLTLELRHVRRPAPQGTDLRARALRRALRVPPVSTPFHWMRLVRLAAIYAARAITLAKAHRNAVLVRVGSSPLLLA